MAFTFTIPVQNLVCNSRSEVSGTKIAGNYFGYAYDLIDTHTEHSLNDAATDTYTANNFNQYTQVNTDNLAYDADGQQKSAKLKAEPLSDRDFEAAQLCGTRCAGVVL